ncbi:hypothetical protein P7C70_g7300, partial [Phenoliferia sp. Uapishka_3]
MSNADDTPVWEEEEEELEETVGLLSNETPSALGETGELTPQEALGQSVEGDQSPFPEVAACVPNTDDPTIQVNNFRLWVLLTVFVIVFAGVNQFFSLRYPSISVGYVVAQLLVFPIGKGWEKLPTWRIRFRGHSFRLNPGKFKIKEHAVITICINLTGSTAYAMDSLVAITSSEFWGRDYGAGFGFCYILTTQMLGFGFAGLARRWIVYPGALIWPSSLASTVLFRALHEKEDRSPENGWTMSRYALNFAAVTGMIFHTFLYNRKDIIAKFRDSKAGGEDIHKRLMRSYKDVPDWVPSDLSVCFRLGKRTTQYCTSFGLGLASTFIKTSAQDDH